MMMAQVSLRWWEAVDAGVLGAPTTSTARDRASQAGSSLPTTLNTTRRVSGRFFSPNYPQHYPPDTRLRQVLLSQLPSTLPAGSQAGSSLPTTLNTTRRILGASTRSLARRLSASRSRFRTSALNMSTAGKRYVILVICPRLYSVVFFVFVTILS